MSFPRKRESRDLNHGWIPDYDLGDDSHFS